MYFPWLFFLSFDMEFSQLSRSLSSFFSAAIFLLFLPSQFVERDWLRFSHSLLVARVILFQSKDHVTFLPAVPCKLRTARHFPGVFSPP